MPTVGPTPEPEAAAAANGGGNAPPQTIRVTVEVLEDLMMLVTELVLTRNQLLQLARNQGEHAFAVPLQRLSHITTDLQEGVMKTRMQPIGNAWTKLPRLVRDLAREMGKKIDLEMRGAETELDRQVLELIKDPLTHMVRNSGDHGLERPEERRRRRQARDRPHPAQRAATRAATSSSRSPTTAAACRSSGSAQKVLANGLATEAELAGDDASGTSQRFIFRAGLLHRGRGHRRLRPRRRHGRGEDQHREASAAPSTSRARAGHGTTFTIKIPLTLAIVSALIVEAGGERFAIPQISVVELVRAEGGGAATRPARSVIERINDTPVLRLRDRLLPLVNLNRLLALGEPADDDTGAYIVVAQVGGRQSSASSSIGCSTPRRSW